MSYVAITNKEACLEALRWRDLAIYAEDMRKDLLALVEASKGHGYRTERAIAEDLQARRAACVDLAKLLGLDR